jgi:hypothetical protein
MEGHKEWEAAGGPEHDICLTNDTPKGDSS